MVGKIVIFMILFLNQISELELFYQVELYFISCLFPLKYSHYKKGRIKAWFFFPLIYQFSEKWVFCHMTNEFVFVFNILFQLIVVIVILMLKFSCLWLVEALSVDCYVLLTPEFFDTIFLFWHSPYFRLS